MTSLSHRLRIGVLVACLSCAGLSAQTDRISAAIDARRSVVLHGNRHPQAIPQNDRGAAEGSFPVAGMTFLLKPSADQQTALQQLLAAQQNPGSPNYRQWLTPEQYADSFGVTAADLAKITGWLTSQGFTIDNVSRSRTFITFSGTAAQTGSAFHTEIHRYLVNGRTHYANATDPSIPAALSGVISSIHGLNDFRLKPRLKLPTNPQLNSGSGHYVAPDDFATIYDVSPLYQAGIDGTGQKIAVAGQTAIQLSDIQQFRTKFGLSAPNLTQVLVRGSANPGISSTDLPEADLDIEWSGAIAFNAQIVYVYSTDVFQSALYAIDQNLAPVLSMSYGGCEGGDLVDLPAYQTMAQQANAQGITWLAAAGDFGAADCEDQGASIAQDGLAVDAPGSIPEVTAMGGTTFNEQGGSYWASNGAALAYIPEKVWNDTSLAYGLAAGGGGGSIFFPQPIWQNGPGVPTDGVRHVPDISFSSSPEHDPYYFYSQGSSGGVGGTSVAAPSMAGVVALLNQYLTSTGAQPAAGLGNINPMLYRLAQSNTGIFHDVATGNNSVPCVTGSPDCTGGMMGFSAGAGYDQATGLGSVDVANLVHGWSGQSPVNSAVVLSLDQNPVFQQTADAAGNSWRFTLTLTEEAGIPTTLTALTVNGGSFLSNFKTSMPARGSQSATIGLNNLAVPTSVVFVASGVDAGGTPWTQQLSIPFTGPQVPLTIAGIANGASFQQVYAPGMILSVFGTQLGNFAQSFGTVPLPQYLAGFEAAVNGVPAPLYYVSPTQVNLQIPYETQPGPATLTVGNPYVNVNYNFQVAATAPGIFTSADGALVPFPTAGQNQAITLYITGDGLVSPSLATGSAPAAGTPTSRLPKPRGALTVTVGSVPATTTFVGIPAGYVGVTQINFTVPPGLSAGVQPVVVTVGNASSAPAKLTIQ
jgi:uncharacterized protein (TIGR03437 family)